MMVSRNPSFLYYFTIFPTRQKILIVICVISSLLLISIPIRQLLFKNKSQRYNKIDSIQSLKKLSKMNNFDERNLQTLFMKIDASADRLISEKELSWYINQEIAKHMKQSLRANMMNFFKLDKLNPNGLIDWQEWFQFFESKLKPESFNTRDTLEKISAAKAAWSEAARSNPNSLNIDEFLAFTHSEFSQPLIIRQVEDTLLMLDGDKNEALSLDEFISNPSLRGEDADSRNRLEDKKREFEISDTDGDGVLSRRELLVNCDVKSNVWATIQASRLIRKFDTDKDKKLSLEEFTMKSSSTYNFDDRTIIENLNPKQFFHEIDFS